jgi:Adenylosuccinate lyase (EC 4.3.2.2)
VGNYNAYMVAYPDIDWVKFTKEFILKLEIKEKDKKILLNPTPENYIDIANKLILETYEDIEENCMPDIENINSTKY